MNTRQELMRCLQPLPAHTGKRVSTSVIYGFVGRGYMLGRLARVSGDYVIRPGTVNLCTQYVRGRRLFRLQQRHSGFIRSLNTSLSGGRDYPMLTGILGIATGVVSAGAGIAFSVICTAVSASRQPQNVLAREGDEIWQAEMVGKENNALKHVMYYWLVDPYRQQAQRTVPAAWIIHEDRKDLVP